MTRTTNGSSEMIRRWALLVVALSWSACGMRSALHAPGAGDDDDGGWWGGDGGAGGGGKGGSAVGGSAKGGSAGSRARGGSGGTVARGGSGGSRARGGSGGSRARGGSGGTVARGGSGGSRARGGSGGSRARGGSGGAVASGGNAGSGAGGSIVVLPDGAALPVGIPVIDPDSSHITLAAGNVVMIGVVTSASQGLDSWIRVSSDGSSFCASGSVSASQSYSSWAVAGFTVNQLTQDSGAVRPLVLDGSSISITYSNRAGSTLQLQLWDSTGGNYWCHDLYASPDPTTITIKLSELNSKCWDDTGIAFTPGTAITAIHLVVPSDVEDPTPIDFCFLGLSVQ